MSTRSHENAAWQHSHEASAVVQITTITLLIEKLGIPISEFEERVERVLQGLGVAVPGATFDSEGTRVRVGQLLSLIRAGYMDRSKDPLNRFRVIEGGVA